MRLNVTSEIGKLKSVLVHLPGREIDVMVPPMMAQLLFDDILFGQVAREEHRRFQQLIRFVAEEVFDIQDLLEEVFDDDGVIVSGMATQARRREALLSKYVFQYHHTFRDLSAKGEGGTSSIFWADFM